MDKCRSKDELEAALAEYVKYYNEKRPCYAIGYDTPINYRKRFYKEELEQKDTVFKERTV
ncbi:IS3 family transposase [Bacteroides thetaiotaomicron]|uniref:IS3 family transposase n=1 Tax=Bacteroides thetaiotaomicron TaxID=818 RepID=UPI00374D3C6B